MSESISLIDTSAWISYFHQKHNSPISEKVAHSISTQTAGICEMVLLELRKGSGTFHKRKLELVESVSMNFSIDSEVWNYSYKFAELLRSKGTPVPNSDILIFATASRYGLELIHQDKHFEMMKEALG